MARYKARIVERKVLGDAPRPRACIGPRYGISLSVTQGLPLGRLLQTLVYANQVAEYHRPLAAVELYCLMTKVVPKVSA